MSVYISLDNRKEIKKRIRNIDSIRENLKDAQAELEEVEKRDPLTATKGSGDVAWHGNTGSDKTHPGIRLPNREKVLKDRIAQYSAIVHDFDRGWNMLTGQQKEYLTERYKRGRKQTDIAKDMGYTDRYVRYMEREALAIMENEMIKV